MASEFKAIDDSDSRPVLAGGNLIDHEASSHALIAAPDAVLLIDDASSRLVAFNSAAETMFGWTAAEVIGQSLDMLRPPEDAGGLETFPPTIGADGPAVWEVACRDRAGRAFSAEAAAAAFNHGGVPLWVVMLRDVSGRKGVVDALMDAEERLASITANLPGIVFQRVKRADGSIHYPFFTDGVRDILGYAPEEMRITTDGSLDAMHWADRERHRGDVELSSINLQPCPEEFRAITRTGEVRWLSGTSRPHVLANGDVLWDGLLIDITERKRAELRLEMIMDHAADSIITADEDGYIESANAAAVTLFGRSADAMVGHRISEMMAATSRLEHERQISDYLETGEEQQIAGTREYLGLRPDGVLFPFELSISEVRMEGRRLFIFIGRDISQRKRTEEALRESEVRLRNIASNVPGIVFQRILDRDGELHFLYVSEGSRDLLDIPPAEIIKDARVFLQVLTASDRDRHLHALRHSAATLEPVEDELRVTSRSGKQRWLRGWSRPRRLATGEVAWDGVMLDVTDRKEAEERLRFLAYYDPVTGVANRALFLDHLGEAAITAAADGTQVVVMCLGIDRFSIINSTLGHTVGDMVLAAAARRLQNCLERRGTVARAGGDRFLILVPGLRSEAEISRAVDTIVAVCGQPLSLMGDEFDLTASIGVSVLPRDGSEPETVVKHADTALMRAKTHGPGTVQIFTEEMNELAIKTLGLQNRMRRAFDHDEFVPFFQPQVDLASGELIGMEALARWISPEMGMVSPVEFIPVAEEYGLIDPLCDAILRAACRLNKSWQVAGLPSVPVAVNISGRQFQNAKRLLQSVEAALAETGLDPQYLELELTESSAMRDPENAIAVVGQLRDRGIACSIDDFGTGYSSLSVLKRFPIQKLKIDRSFVRDVITDANDAAIVRAIVAMAHALRMKVVAEGVEVNGHLDFLRDAACDQIQGFLFSKPLPAAEMEALMRSGRRLQVPALT